MTAKEFIENTLYITKDGEPYDVCDSLERVKEAFIKFAQLHVEAALKAVNEKVEIHSDSGSSYHREFEEAIRNKTIWVPSNSILNAYPLSNIQ